MAMHDLKRLLLMDLQRAFSGIRFWALAAGVAALYFCNTLAESIFMDHFMLQESVMAAISISRGTFFTQMMLILATLAYGDSFCEDWKNRNIRNVIVRSNPAAYAVSKMISCAVSAFAVLFVGNLLFVLLEGVLTQNMNGDENSITAAENLQQLSAFDQLKVQHKYGIWIGMQAARNALEGTVFATMALTLSAVMTNPFVVLTFPIFLYFFTQIILQTGKVPDMVNFSVLYEVDGVCIGQSVALHMIWTVAITILLCVVFGYFFLRGVRRKFENG